MSFIGIDDRDELDFEALPAASFVALALMVVAYLTFVEYWKALVLQPPTGCRGCSPSATGSSCAPPGGALESCRCNGALGVLA
jgi:hypothetical protein